ncbi:MAG: restriction endonuclease [Candidatus Omnitrophota bacterium]|jgi:hypothetical protein
MDEQYVRKLEEAIKKFMAPLEDIPFPIAIKAISGYEVIAFDKNNADDKTLLEKLSEAAAWAGENAKNVGIKSNRPNEVGNYIEPFVKNALIKVGLKAGTPRCKSGRRQSTGYPDIEIVESKDRVTYLECKTYSLKNIDTTQRAFYFSPSEEGCKITADARHLVLSYQIELKSPGVYIPVHWRLYCIESMAVQVKHEFNTDNRQMYRKEALLAEGKI